MQFSIPFNSPSAIGICFGDVTRATCFRRWAATEFQEARIACKMHTRGERKSGKERKRPFDRIIRPQWKLFHDPIPALSRMTLSGFLVAIPTSSILISRNIADHPGWPASPVYLKTAPWYSSDLFTVFRHLLLSKTRSNEKLETFSKILDTWHVLGGLLFPPFSSMPPRSIFLFVQYSFPPNSVVRNSFEEFSEVGRWKRGRRKKVNEREEMRAGRIKKARGRWANSSNHASRCLVINRAHENELLRHQRPSRSSQQLHITEKSCPP